MVSSYLLSFLFLFSFLPLIAPRAHKVHAYYGNWQYWNNYPVCKIDGNKMDVLFYNFLLTSTGTCTFANNDIELNYAGPVDGVCGSPNQPYSDPVKGNMYQFRKLKQRFPHLKIIASIVGAHEMHASMLSESSREVFTQGCVDLLSPYFDIFDGIDMDLEYPCLSSDQYCGGILPSANDGDKPAFVELVKSFRAKLPVNAYMSFAMNLDFIKQDAYDFASLDQYVDAYHLMTYNIADGSWTSYSGHHTQPYGNPNDPIEWRSKLSTFSSAQYFITKNLGIVDPKKVFIAACFYGRGFKISPSTYNNNPFVPSLGVTGTGSYHDTPNIFYYWDIKQNIKKSTNYHFDELAQAPFIYDGTKGIYISYDDPLSVQAKVDMVHQLGIGGLFAWEIGMDKEDELLTVMNNNPTQCSPSVCAPSNNCVCPGYTFPGEGVTGGLTLLQVPQFVILGFTDGLTSNDFAAVSHLDSVLSNVVDSMGCTPRVTGYFSGIHTDYNTINWAGYRGSVGAYGYTQTTSLTTDALTWEAELSTLKSDFENLALAAPVGSRAPHYQTNDAYYQQLIKSRIRFDSSMISKQRVDGRALWPFTMNFPASIEPEVCNRLGTCPSKAYKGLWEVPIVAWDSLDENNFADFNVDEHNYDAMLARFKESFQNTYQTNRAPRSLNFRWNYFSEQWFDAINQVKLNFFNELLGWITTTYPDIVFATESQVLDWIKNPKSLDNLRVTWNTDHPCPDKTLIPEHSCLDGIQRHCQYDLESIVVCGNMCPSSKPGIGVQWSFVSDGVDITDATGNHPTTGIVTVEADSTTGDNTGVSTGVSGIGGTGSTGSGSSSTTDPNATPIVLKTPLTGPNAFQNRWMGVGTINIYSTWWHGFCAYFDFQNPSTEFAAIQAAVTISHCSKIGTITSLWGYPYSSHLDGHTNKYSMIGNWLQVTPGQSSTFFGGFCMQTMGDQYILPQYFRFGVDAYSEKLNCDANTCQVFCGDGVCDETIGETVDTCQQDCDPWDCSTV